MPNKKFVFAEMVWVAKEHPNALLLTVKSIFDINYNKTQRSLVGILICAEVWVMVT